MFVKKRWESLVDFVNYRLIGSPGTRGLYRIWYWIRCHTISRYHVINISGEDYYKWGWIDRDHAMFLACFKLLKQFVEEEDPKVGLRSLEDYVSHTTTEEGRDFILLQLQNEREIRAIYNWWTKERAQDHAKLEAEESEYYGHSPLTIKDLTTKRTPEELAKVREFAKKRSLLAEKDDDMLLRLIHVRKSLWT